MACAIHLHLQEKVSAGVSQNHLLCLINLSPLQEPLGEALDSIMLDSYEQD
jgi:hypothetical protein